MMMAKSIKMLMRSIGVNKNICNFTWLSFPSGVSLVSFFVNEIKF